jgi:hypothetical protein
MRKLNEVLRRTVVITLGGLLTTAVVVGALIAIMFALEPLVGSLASGLIAIIAVAFTFILLSEMTNP